MTGLRLGNNVKYFVVACSGAVIRQLEKCDTRVYCFTKKICALAGCCEGVRESHAVIISAKFAALIISLPPKNREAMSV